MLCIIRLLLGVLPKESMDRLLRHDLDTRGQSNSMGMA
jgi:hypothetical protein